MDLAWLILITLEIKLLSAQVFKKTVRSETLQLLGGKEVLTETQVTKECRRLSLVNVGCRQVGKMGSEKGELMGFELSWVRSRRNMLSYHIIPVRAVSLYVEGCIMVRFL